MSIYVCSDLHGRYDLYNKMLETIKFNKKDTLYILGDAIDRGPESIKLLQQIMKQKNVVLLKGNHEKMMLQYLKTQNIYDAMVWEYNGGEETHNQYKKLTEKEKQDIFYYLNNLPNYVILPGVILVHAGINNNIKSTNIEEFMEAQDVDDLVWIREPFINRPTNIENYTVIFGHTPTKHLQRTRNRCTIWVDLIHEYKIGIDCGAYSDTEGQLCCIELIEGKSLIWYINNQGVVYG